MAGLRWPAVIVASGTALAVLLATDAGGPVRGLLALWFLLVCTGMAFVPLLHLPSVGAELALGVAVSLGIDTVAATALLVAGGLSATSGLLVLGAICVVGCALQARARVGARRTGPRPATP